MERLGRTWRIVILIGVAAATLYILIRIRGVLMPFAFGAALAYLLYPAVLFLESRGLGKTTSIIVLYAFALGAGGVIAFYTIPHLTREIINMAYLYPRYIGEVRVMFDEVQGLAEPVSLNNALRIGLDHLEGLIYKEVKSFFAGFLDMFGSFLSLVFAPILAYYFIVDWEKIRDGFLSLFPMRLRLPIKELAMEINQVLWGFIKGELLVSLIVGVMVGAAAAALGIRYALIIGLISGIAELFPYFGPILGAVPALALALPQSLQAAIYLGLVIIIVQQLESNLIAPRILGDRVGLHPLLVILALLAGGSIGGIWGMLLAVPAAAVIRVLMRFLFYQIVD